MKWFKFYGQDFLTDSKLGALNPFQRLMWVALLCVASQDDEKTGVLRFFDESRLVALAGLNYEDMESMYGMKRNETLETFCNMGLVTRLDKDTIIVTNYHKKQTQQSTSTERVQEWRARNKAKKDGFGYVTKETDVMLQRNGRIEENRKEKNIYTTGAVNDTFEAFWGEYPRKVGKPAAARAWRGIKNTPIQEILSGVARWKESDQWTRDGGRFIPHPSTFLNQRRWEDTPEINNKMEVVTL